MGNIIVTTEKQIEQKFIQTLVDLKYCYRPEIKDNITLEQNFREKFNLLNNINLSDEEFSSLKHNIIKGDVFGASKLLRQQNSLLRDDGTVLYYTIVHNEDWCKNSFEVINQLRINTENSHHRYDIILLINGIPLVQIELKSLDFSPYRAIQQIIDYKNDTGNGYIKTLLSFIQIFIVSNRTSTWYFANNNNKHFTVKKSAQDEKFLPIYQYADENNQKIVNLDKFADTFLRKCNLGDMISKYMVLLEVEKKLLMMRPYQIYAVKAIVKSIHQNSGNGYIWHTTGSGKTLTSFKASTLLKNNPDIEKCLFVVDRKDLDRQTRDEFNRFQENCVEENNNTEILVNRMLSDDYADRIIVTTIQKLGIALGKKGDTTEKYSKAAQENQNKGKYREQLKHLSNKRIVFIFDECHRSQFGEYHKSIKDFFPKAQLFGFTGTPIFEENSEHYKINEQEKTLQTTEHLFQHQLHKYTVTDAIEDKNVLRFHIDYYDYKNINIHQQNYNYESDAHKNAVVKKIIAIHNTASFERKFNAIFATSSIDSAIKYYKLFKEKQEQQSQQENVDSNANSLAALKLNIACIFSPPAIVGNKDNQEAKQIQEDLPQEKEDNKINPEGKKQDLQRIIDDYNQKYGTNFSLNNFDLYYKDVQTRVKDQQYSNADYSHANKIDIIIVVDMLLTGFDSTYLNTIYVDKKLQYHGLIQAFSRTNRVLNDTKPYGNVIDFRQQEAAVIDAITLFSGLDAQRSQEIWLVEPVNKVIAKFKHAVLELKNFMQSQGLQLQADDVVQLKGDRAKSKFINCFKEVQKLKTKLAQYTDLTDTDKTIIEQAIPKDEFRAFKSSYLELARKIMTMQKQPQVSAEIAELDLEFTLFNSTVIDYDFIMKLIAQYTGSTAKSKMTKDELVAMIASDPKFMDDVDDLTAYINSLTVGVAINEQDIKTGYEEFKKQRIIKKQEDIAKTHGVDLVGLQKLIEITIDLSRFDSDLLLDLLLALGLPFGGRMKKQMALMQDLIPLLKQMAGNQEIWGLKAYEEIK